MTDSARELVRATRRRLMVHALLLAFGWGLAIGWLTLTLGRIVQPLWAEAAPVLPVLALPAGLAAVAVVLWRERHIRHHSRVALWLEERFPRLRYALVTLLDHDGRSTPHTARLQQQVTATIEASDTPPLARQMRWRLWRNLAVILPVLLLAALVEGITATSWYREWRIEPAMIAGRETAAPIDRLGSLTAELTPPAYTGWPAQMLDDVDSIAGLAGSAVILRGKGGPAGIVSRLESGTSLSVAGDDEGWSVAFVMPGKADALMLSDDDMRRIVVLEPRSDDAPQVRLILPESDQTVTEATGMVELSARISDDIGLARGWFEIIVASGEGEGNYEFRESTLLETAFDGASGVLRTTVALESFALQPGGQVSIRAVATDRNDLTGPGTGYSETRTIRLARSRQAADAIINPAPPALDESLMSLRMLIRDTERLDARRLDMEQAVFASAATPLSRHADTIRDKVQALVDTARNDGAFEVPPLLTVALDAMWEGSRNLAVAETGEALPHLRRAHEALKALGNMTRYFFRGEAMPAIADVDKVRMTGDEPVAAGPRSTRGRTDSARERLAARLAAVRPHLRTRPEEAIEALTLMRVETLRDLPAATPLLEQVLLAMHGDGEPAAALARLRIMLEGEPIVHAELPQWAPMPGGRP